MQFRFLRTIAPVEILVGTERWRALQLVIVDVGGQAELRKRAGDVGDDARNMDEAAGFGLGLSIANAIVLAHGGTLSLHDRLLQGLVVRLQLPVRQESQRTAA